MIWWFGNKSEKHQPEPPKAFGVNTAWYVVSSDDNEAVGRALAVGKMRPCSWSQGVRIATGSVKAFITPPIQGFVVVASIYFCAEDDKVREQVMPRLARLSEEFGIAQYFCNHDVPDGYGWARADDGNFVRGFAWLKEKNQVLWNEGGRTAVERRLGVPGPEMRGTITEPTRTTDEELDHYLYITVDTLFTIARDWSISPIDIPKVATEPTVGLVGRHALP